MMNARGTGASPTAFYLALSLLVRGDRRAALAPTRVSKLDDTLVRRSGAARYRVVPVAVHPARWPAQHVFGVTDGGERGSSTISIFLRASPACTCRRLPGLREVVPGLREV
jgi:hypothetical protein